MTTKRCVGQKNEVLVSDLVDAMSLRLKSYSQQVGRDYFIKIQNNGYCYLEDEYSDDKQCFDDINKLTKFLLETTASSIEENIKIKENELLQLKEQLGAISTP